MRSHDIRIARLKELVAELSSVAEVARRAETSETNLRNILNGVLNSAGNPKGVGDRLARKLEIAFEKELGWLDTQQQLPANALRLLRDWNDLTLDMQKAYSKAIAEAAEAQRRSTEVLEKALGKPLVGDPQETANLRPKKTTT